jgi:putative membrane protein
MEEIEPILAEAGITHLPLDDDYVQVSRLMILRRSITVVLPVAAAIVAASFWRPLALLLLIPLPIIAAGFVLGWRRHRYVLAEGALYIGEGLIRPRLWIMPFGKAQTVSVRRTVLQRWLGLATVEVDTAGASAFRYPAVRDLEPADADRLAARLIDEYRSARLALRSAR